MKYRPFVLILPFLASCSLFPAIGNSGSDSALSSSSVFESSSSAASTRTLEVYAINDFHGAVKEEGSYPGIETVGSYFARRGEEENTVLVSSGDMFQGSLESNYNSGHLLADVMNECEFDALSLGNHDFDWGLEALRSNKERVSSSGYQTPYLCANLYDYANSKQGNVQQSDYAGEYVVKVQENGLRVGIIGAIGASQFTSITSSRVEDVCFKNPTPIIKTLSDKLRVEENCDIVILSFHAGQSAMLGQGVTSISPNSGKRYVDLVLCAHTHRYESATENGVIFTQNYDKGENASHVTLTVSESGEVSGKLETISAAAMKEEAKQEGYDKKISDLVNTYGQESETIGNETLGTLNGSFDSYGELPNLVAEAMLEEASASFSGVDIAMVNNGRERLSSGSLTYSALFSALPFDNEVYILETSGETLMKEASYNFIARGNEEAFESDGTYRVAVIDYLAVHQNTKRVYDYFPNSTIVGTVSSSDGGKRTYRDIAADYIREAGTVSSADYSSNLVRYNKELLSTSVSL